jgi:hypothetical protein
MNGSSGLFKSGRLLILALVLAVGFASLPAITSALAQFTVFSQGFEVDTQGWLTSIGSSNYGTLARVNSGTDGINSATGNWHAKMGGNSTGSPTGPFSRFGSYQTNWNGGFTASIDVYLDTSWANGEGFDYSVAANRQNNTHLRDFIWHVGKVNGNLLVNASNNSDANFNAWKLENENGSNYYTVTNSGWYTLRHIFREESGSLVVDFVLLDSAGTILHTITRTTPADDIASIVGGNRYAWFVYISVVDGLHTDNVKLAYVNQPPVHNVTQNQYFYGIQAAIDAATAGDTINIAAGTYTENLTINKALTLNGAQDGVSVSGRTKGGANESTVVGEISLANVSNVNIDGFTLKNPGALRLLYLNASNGTTPVSNVKIANNFVTEVGSPTLCDNVHVIFLNRGPDNVTIEGNHLSNLRSGRSISAISLLDTVSTNSSENVVIRNNVFDDIASVATTCSAPSPRGAYGIISNNAAGSPSLRVLGNTFSNFNGSWTHAVGLEGPTQNAVVLDNTFSNLSAVGADKSAVFFEANPLGNTVSVLFNEFNGSNFFGVAIHPGDLPGGSRGLNYIVDARHNWWGNASGPGNPGTAAVDPVTGATANGNGAYVGTNIRFDEWLRPNPATVAYNILAASAVLNGPSSTATNNGPGSYLVALSQFAGNPSNVANFSGAGTFFDVYVNGATASDSLTVVLPAVGNKALYYYNGTDWLPVKVGGNKVFPSGGTYTFVLSNTSEPKLIDLNGTPFAGAGNEEIRITPSATTVSAGQTFQVVVDAGSDALFGVDVRMAFSAAQLEVTSIALGTGLQPGTIAVNTYNNGAGTLQFAYSQLGSSESNVSGTNVTLATITFLAKAAGNPSISLGTVLFTDRDGNPTVPAPLDSPINLTVNPSPSVYVDVALQGRSDHAGLELQVSPVGPGNVLYDNTVVAGKLEIPTVPSGTYEARVSAPKYLAAVQTFTVSTQSVYDLNAPGGTPASGLILALRGGDINGDDQINIQDLVLIGVNFGSTTVLTSDINGDGVVNIQDLAIAAGNFGLKTGVDDYAGYPNDLWD